MSGRAPGRRYRRPAPAAGTLALLVFLALGLGWANSSCGFKRPLTSAAYFASGPSTVQTEQDADGRWRYLVNGEPSYLIGMGYNAIYRYLSEDDRAVRYERDFAVLKAAGVNTILGWDFDKGVGQDRFDFLTLDAAHQAGLGVVMPYYLPFEADYTDAEFRENIRSEVAAKVERYRGHPALRMWGLGNEVLNDMSAERRAVQGRPFWRFLMELADLIHAIDPNHPVIYRESGDIYLNRISRALLRQEERPWFLYGMNLYAADAEAILDSWPDYGLNKPLFVTEFGPPADWPYAERKEIYVGIWRAIRARTAYILGGAPYVWTVKGPEPVDEFYGLTDGAARPVDDTFAALQAEFLKVP